MCRHVIRHNGGEVCKVQSSPFDRSKSHDNDALNCIKIAANIDIVEVFWSGSGRKVFHHNFIIKVHFLAFSYDSVGSLLSFLSAAVLYEIVTH